MTSPAPNLVGGGDVNPGRFCTLTASGTVIQCNDSADLVVGVSQITTRRFNDPLCFKAGEPALLQTSPNGVLQVYCGATGIAAKKRIASDANGRAIEWVPDGGGQTTPFVGYMALRDGAPGELMPIYPAPGSIYQPAAYTGLTGGGTGA